MSYLCVHQESVVPRRMNFFASLTFESIDIINLISLGMFALGSMQSYNLDIWRSELFLAHSNLLNLYKYHTTMQLCEDMSLFIFP